ncbi:Thioredoxin [Alkalibacterium sp. AK22]|uniref:thioredoxin family protein n=1 Tax=Alkalibacterium sp. AK22 TaxID=1229520 RepID=UPI00044B8556|nr:thioredoxin family protein [Alkalibacterium sp. AK22]EXJ23002.1 Thioredoxin [Alkalibacterium sp. AK22]
MQGFKEAKSLHEVRELIDQEKLVLCFFYGEHCSVCHGVMPQLKPVIDGFSKLKSIQADVEKMPEFSGAYTVFTVPVVLLFFEGKEVLRMARFIEKEKLRHQINKILDAMDMQQ